MNKKIKIALTILGIFLLAVPLGLLTDAPAWGEWDNDYYKKVLGFVPKGMESFHSFISPILPDYSLPGTNDVIGYYVSAIVGAILVFLIWFIIGKIIAKKHSNS